MKLLFIGNVGYRFNAFAYSSSLAAKELGIEFHIAGSWTGYSNPEDKKFDEEKYGIKIHQIDFIRTPYDPRNIKAYKQIVNLIKKENFDIIHCNTPIGGVVGRLAGQKCGIKPVIYQAHGFHFYDGAPWLNWLIYYPIERWLAHYTDVLITINQEDYERAKKFHLRNHGKVYYVPGVGIDTDAFQSKGVDAKKTRNALGIPASAIVLVSVGDLNKNKNNIAVIKSLKKLDNPNLHYILCGKGNLLDDLKRESESIQDQIHFLGYRNDIAELMMASDIFVMPSFREGLSRSLMEAMACGLPAVVSKIRGNTDLIRDERFLIDPKDVQGWAEAIERLLVDEQLRNTVGQENRMRVEGFSLSVVEKEILDIYKVVFTD